MSQPDFAAVQPEKGRHRQAIESAGRVGLVAFLGLTLGIVTAHAQAWLPHEVESLANSVGSWALIAFLLALLGTTPRFAAILGFVALVTLLVGYVVGAAVRGDPSSNALVAFWGLASLIAGPILGLSAHWVKTDRHHLAAVGAGVMSGVLIGEGVYGLTYIANTTYPPYWWGEIIVGLVFLAYVAARRLRTGRSTAVAVACSVVVAAAFIVVYGQDLISAFS